MGHRRDRLAPTSVLIKRGSSIPRIATVTADQLVAAYRRWHVPIVERPGWRTRSTGWPFDPIGVVVHHDAMNDRVSTERGLYVIEEGRPDLDGPLSANWHEDDGIVYLCSFGNANHGGRFAAEVVARTRAGLPPRGDALALGLSDDGPIANGLYYGLEVHNAGDGRDPYEPGQMQSLTLTLAALCDLHGWTGARVIGHREGTRRKIDPRGIDMAALREAVDVCLFVGPAVALPTKPTPSVPQEDDMLQVIVDEPQGRTVYLVGLTAKPINLGKLGAVHDQLTAQGVKIIQGPQAAEFLARARAAG